MSGVAVCYFPYAVWKINLIYIFECTVGNDVRKAVLDGWPVENVIASDLRKGWTNISLKLPRLMIVFDRILGLWARAFQVFAGIVPGCVHRWGHFRSRNARAAWTIS